MPLNVHRVKSLNQSNKTWSEHFIQIGANNQHFENASRLTIESINTMFADCTKPYSGLLPQLLKQAIYDSNLAKVEPIATVIQQTNDLIAKNSIMVQHPHCIAHLHTPPLIASVLAEFYIAALNQSMDSLRKKSIMKLTWRIDPAARLTRSLFPGLLKS